MEAVLCGREDDDGDGHEIAVAFQLGEHIEARNIVRVELQQDQQWPRRTAKLTEPADEPQRLPPLPSDVIRTLLSACAKDS